MRAKGNLEMTTITVCKATDTPEMPVADVTLQIEGRMPTLSHRHDWQKQRAILFQEQAALVMQALNTLPYGTMHELLILMLQEKGCLLETGGNG